MNFDQMLESWRAQDNTPMYGINRDLLQLVLQHEQTELRRHLRWEQVTTWVVGIGMAAVAAFILLAFLFLRGPALGVVASAVGMAAFVAWVIALWLSRRRQAQRERGFGNSLRDELGRSLSLVDYQLSRAGRWGAALLWSAPVMVGAMLIYWLGAEINDNTEFWYDASFTIFIIVTVVCAAHDTSRKTKRKLEPRRQRLRELLDSLDATE